MKEYENFMEKIKKVPITRLDKYFDEDAYNLQLEWAREYIEEEENFTVILYRVDKNKVNVDSVFFDTNGHEIKFKDPIELKVKYSIEDTENKTYNDKDQQSLRFQQTGNLIFTIATQQLEELEVDIAFGDYIAVPVTETSFEYFEVVNNGKKNVDNSHTIFGYKPAFRTVTCVTANDIFDRE